MAFKAGAIYGEARLDTKKWHKGLAGLKRATGLAMAAIAAAFVATMVSATKKANEFQKAMANVSTLVDTTKVNMQELTFEILNLSPAIGGTTELTKGMYQAFSSGARTAKDALETTIVAAKFARAALTDTFTAVDVLTTAMNAYGRENMSASKAADIFFQTIKYGKIVGAELAASIGTSIPLFATAGIELEELTAGMAAMTKQGVSAQRATTQLNAIVRAFLAPSEEMQQALYDVGFESGSTFLEVNGLAGALKLIEDNAQGDATALRKLLPNIRGMKGVMALSGQGAKEFAYILGEMANASGVAEEAFEKQEKTWVTMKNAMDKVMIIAGNISKFFIDKLARGATTAAEAMSEFLKSSKGMIFVATIAGYVAGGFELIKEVVQPIIDSIGVALEEIWKAMGDALKTLTGETDTAGAGFNILAIAVNVAAAAFEIMGRWISGIIRLMGNIAKAVVEIVYLLGDFAAAMLDPFNQEKLDALEAAGKRTTQAFGKLWYDLKVDAVKIWNAAEDHMKDVLERSGEMGKEWRVVFKTTYEGVYEDLLLLYDRIITGQMGFGKKMGTSWGNIMSDMSGWSRTLLYETRDKIVPELEAEWFDYVDYVLDLMQRLSSGIFNIISQGFTNEEAEQRLHLHNQLEALEEEKEAEEALLDKKLANETITEDEYNIQKATIDQNYADDKAIIEDESNKKLNDIAKKAFEAGKANRIAQIWIDAASAIMGYAQSATFLGPIAGPILAAAMSAMITALAIAQSVKISEQVFVPSYAKGGAVRVNEQGGEIINLPNNAVVIPNDISRQIASNVGQGTVINVSFAGANISDDVSLDRVVGKVIRKLGKEMRLAV